MPRFYQPQNKQILSRPHSCNSRVFLGIKCGCVDSQSQCGIPEIEQGEEGRKQPSYWRLLTDAHSKWSTHHQTIQSLMVLLLYTIHDLEVTICHKLFL